MSDPIPIMAIKVGDRIGRQTTLKDPDAPIMWLTVTEVNEEKNTIHCNLWTFDRATGAEIDHDQQWGPEYGKSGGFITRIQQMAVVET